MKQSSQNLASPHAFKNNIGHSPLVQVERTFDVRAEEVWKAWCTPELIKQWWGPVHYSAPEVSLTFKVGGRYIFAMKSSEGKIGWTSGVYEQIVPFQKIVFTDHFSDQSGRNITAKEAGMEGEWPEIMYVTVRFEKIGEKTRLHLSHEGIPASHHDDCVRGWDSSLAKLQKLVERV